MHRILYQGNLGRVDDLPDFERDVLAEVRRALSPHGDESASIDIEWSPRASMWFIEVTPTNADAARVSVGSDGDELFLRFAHTHLELWNHKRGPSPIEQLRQYLPAIFRGDFDEAGGGDDRFARVNLPDGKTASVGNAHLPIPWSLRRRRRYASYS